MVEEVSREFRFEKNDEKTNSILDEIKYTDLMSEKHKKYNDLMSEKYKKTGKYLNYVEHLLILPSGSTGCVLISVFASLVCIPVGIASSGIEIKICAINAGIKKV